MTMVGGCAVIGAGFAVVAFAPAFGFALAGMATAGLAEGSVSVSEQGILQRRTPDAVRSRATAATEAAILGAVAGARWAERAAPNSAVTAAATASFFMRFPTKSIGPAPCRSCILSSMNVTGCQGV